MSMLGPQNSLSTSAPLPVQNAYAPSAPDRQGGGAATDGGEVGGAEASTFSFYDFLDIINPLQHIPIVGSVYRAVTGDEIGTAARMIGGAVFGGPIGFAAALANEMVRDESGKDVGEHVIAAFTGDDATGEETAVAENTAVDAPIQTAGEAFPQPMATASGIPSAPMPTGLPDYTAATSTVVETAPLPDVGSPQADAVASDDADPRRAPRGPLFSTEPGFSPYNRPEPEAPAAVTGELAAMPPPTAIRQAMKTQGLNAQVSHPMLNLGPTALPGPGSGRIGGMPPKIVTELQKAPVMPQGLMGGTGSLPGGLPGATPGLPGISSGAATPGLTDLNAPSNDLAAVQQSYTPVPGVNVERPADFDKAMMLALNKYEQMQRTLAPQPKPTEAAKPSPHQDPAFDSVVNSSATP